MKVLIVTTAFPRWRDDTRAPFIFEAAQAVKRLGINVKVVAMHSPGTQCRENWDGIEIRRPRYLPDCLETLQRESGGLPVAWKKSGFSRLAVIPFVFTHSVAVAKYAAGVDLIHANWTLSAGCVWLLKWLHRKPYIVTVHGSDIFEAVKIPVVRWLTGFVLRRAEKVIAVSRALASEVTKLGVPQGSIAVIPNGVDIERFYPGTGERDPIILFVGSHTRVKGGDVLLRAFREVAQAYPDYRLVMVGDGPCRSEWEALANDLRIADRVNFTGELGRDEVAEWMRRAKLFVLPSRSEGLGVVLLEALASGTPCIGSAVGGILDIIDHRVGCLVSSDDEKGFARTIVEFLGRSTDFNCLSMAAREIAEGRFSWNQAALEIIHQYRTVMD